MRAINFNYIYDGSFYGLLNCFYWALKDNELPMNILIENNSFFPFKSIETDEKIAISMMKGIKKRICAAAYEDLRVLYLSSDKNKGIVGLKFLNAGFKEGARVMDMMSHVDVAAFIKMVRLVSKEAHRFIQFIRFSEHEGSLISVIEPEHYILPIIADHFATRFSSASFLIYDKSHGLALIYKDKRKEIVALDEFLEPEYDENEMRYRQLWRGFYDSVAIKDRENLKCRQSFLPKKFWKNMTEFK